MTQSQESDWVEITTLDGTLVKWPSRVVIVGYGLRWKACYGPEAGNNSAISSCVCAP